MENETIKALRAMISLTEGAKQKMAQGNYNEACMILEVAVMIWSNIGGQNPRRVICEP